MQPDAEKFFQGPPAEIENEIASVSSGHYRFLTSLFYCTREEGSLETLPDSKKNACFKKTGVRSFLLAENIAALF